MTYLTPILFSLAFLACGIGIGRSLRKREVKRLKSKLELYGLMLNGALPAKRAERVHTWWARNQ